MGKRGFWSLSDLDGVVQVLQRRRSRWQLVGGRDSCCNMTNLSGGARKKSKGFGFVG